MHSWSAQCLDWLSFRWLLDLASRYGCPAGPVCHPSNACLTSFVSPVQNPQVVEVNALSLNWVSWFLFFRQRQLGSQWWPQSVRFRSLSRVHSLSQAEERNTIHIPRLYSFMPGYYDGSPRVSGFSINSVDFSYQAHRDSTIHQYQTLCQYCFDFLASTGNPSWDVLDVSEIMVCNFLSFHAKTFGVKYRTLGLQEYNISFYLPYLWDGYQLSGVLVLSLRPFQLKPSSKG